MLRTSKHPLKNIAVGLFLLSGYSLAGDTVNLNVTGNVVASPCQVSYDSLNKTVDLGQNIQSSDLRTAGASTTWVNFNINIDSCPTGTTKATMTMHGAADTSDPASLYTNTGTAANVAVQVQMLSGEAMGDGKSYTGNIVSNAYTYKMQARAYTAAGNVTPGTISSVITATFTYQ